MGHGQLLGLTDGFVKVGLRDGFDVTEGERAICFNGLAKQLYRSVPNRLTAG